MQEFLDLLFSNNIWVLVALCIIFLFCVAVVLRRLFGFFLTILCILIAVAAGYIGYNHEAVQKLLHGDKNLETSEQKKEQMKQQAEEALEWLKNWSGQKADEKKE
jgi:Na+/H+ antiporter NhaB